MTGPNLPNPYSRVNRFEFAARGAVELLQSMFPEELQGVSFGFTTIPTEAVVGAGTASASPQYYSIDRASRTIMLHRVPIQRAHVLHVDDAEHRRYFIEHCVYLAVCEYLGREPWELLPGRFDHF